MKSRWLGRQDYVPCWKDMQTFTDGRDESTTASRFDAYYAKAWAMNIWQDTLG